MTHDDLYNRENFPRFVVNHGNWDICANESGYCAAIPTSKAEANGCKASHFGDLAYVRATLARELQAQESLPKTPAEAEAAGFGDPSSFGYPGNDHYECVYRHSDGRKLWFYWRTPLSEPRVTASAQPREA